MKDEGIFTMDTACDVERRAFLRALTVTTAALAAGACGGSPRAYVGAAPNSPPPPPPGNVAPVWSTVPTITFTQGVASSISIAAYVTDADQDPLTITMTTGTLPTGVTYDVASKSFVYDGIGPVDTKSGVQLTADDGQP